MKLSSLPLNALRAFDATARHLSFTRAAAELGVTPGAVARQVHALEDRLKVQLVFRSGMNLLLTDAAQAARPRLCRIFEDMGKIVEDMISGSDIPSITISVHTSFASLWLAPRLQEFRQLEPDTDIRIITPTIFSGGLGKNVDIAITYMAPPGGDYFIQPLKPERMMPLGSPGLIDQVPAINSPEDFLKQPLVHIDTVMQDNIFPSWEQWFKSCDVSGSPTGPSTRVSLSLLSMQAAIAGQGFAFLSLNLAQEYLDRGDLIQPLGIEYSLPLERSLISRNRGVAAHVARFQDWLLDKLL